MGAKHPKLGKADKHFAFEQLPRDLVWMILDLAPESIFHLRMTSQSLKTLVDEYVCLSISKPHITELRFSRGEASTVLNIFLHAIIKSNPLALLRHSILNHNDWEWVKSGPDAHTALLTFDLFNNDLSMLQQLSEYIGRVVGKVVIWYSHGFNLLMEIIYTILEEKQFPKLEITIHRLSDDAVSNISNLIKNHNVDDLKLDVINVDTALNPVQILQNLSSAVLSLYIYQRKVETLGQIEDRCGSYLLGSRNSDWAPIIIDLFSRRLDKLHIKSDHWFLSSESAITLAQTLPHSGKHLFFQATYSGRIIAVERVRAEKYTIGGMGSIIPRPKREFRDIEDNENLSPLERLPPGLLYDINEYTPLHIFKLRMASPLLQVRADQYARLDRNIPVVQEIRFSRRDNSSTLGVVIYFSRAYPLFKLRLLCTQPNDVISRLQRLHTGCFAVKFDLAKENLGTLEHISRYMGKNFEKVVIVDACDDVDIMGAIWRFVKTKRFSKLQLVSACLTDDAVFFASKIIDHNRLDEFTLAVEQVDLGRPLYALKHLASRVRTLHVYQSDVEGIALTEPYLLGLYNVDWAPTIRAAFSGRLETLYIRTNYPFLTNDHAISLSLHLPRTKKPLLFAASYSADEGLPGDQNYIIDFISIRSGKALRIVHQSRKDEKIHDTFYKNVSPSQLHP